MALWLQILLGLLGGVIVFWLALVAFLLLQQRRSGQATDWREIARLAVVPTEVVDAV